MFLLFPFELDKEWLLLLRLVAVVPLLIFWRLLTDASNWHWFHLDNFDKDFSFPLFLCHICDSPTATSSSLLEKVWLLKVGLILESTKSGFWQTDTLCFLGLSKFCFLCFCAFLLLSAMGEKVLWVPQTTFEIFAGVLYPEESSVFELLAVQLEVDIIECRCSEGGLFWTIK